MYEDFATKLATTMWADYDHTPNRKADTPRITDVSTTIIDGNFPWTIVVIETDEGMTGIGEAYPSPGVREVITDYLRPLLIDENPLDVERLYHLMRESLSGRGSQQGIGRVPNSSRVVTDSCGNRVTSGIQPEVTHARHNRRASHG